MTDLREVGVREFREKVSTFTEPVKVYHTRGQLKFLGTWYPAGWEESQRDWEESLRERMREHQRRIAKETSPNMGVSEMGNG